MANHKLANGYILTDEEIEKRAQEWEEGTWSGELVELHVGRPRLSGHSNANMSFKCPTPAADLIASAAKIEGVKKSQFMREAAIEKAMCVLAAQA